MKFESRTSSLSTNVSRLLHTLTFSLNDLRLIDETQRHTELNNVEIFYVCVFRIRSRGSISEMDV